MSDDREPDDEPTLRRNRLMGRLVIVGFGLLLAAYVVATFWRR